MTIQMHSNAVKAASPWSSPAVKVRLAGGLLACGGLFWVQFGPTVAVSTTLGFGALSVLALRYAAGRSEILGREAGVRYGAFVKVSSGGSTLLDSTMRITDDGVSFTPTATNRLVSKARSFSRSEERRVGKECA